MLYFMVTRFGACFTLRNFLTLLCSFNFFFQNYTDHVGRKSTFRLLNRGSAKALDKVVELDGTEAI